MGLRINGDRLWDALMTTSRIGATSNGGLTRLTLSDEDRVVRNWFGATCQEAGLRVTVDDMGNMFARRPGRRDDLAPILIGSHLDSQPRGGKFDGVLGVLAALEAVRTLNDADVRTEHPIEIVNWTNEEGARFAPPMLASGVFAGIYSKAFAHDRRDRDGLRFNDELARIGYLGEEACGNHPVAGYLELHIEQGPVLEAEGMQVGVVTGVQGMRWFDLHIQGMAAHAGTTPMRLRYDAAVGAARAVEAIRRIAMEYDDKAVATTGSIRMVPGSRSVVPGEAWVTVDVRHPDVAVLDYLEEAFRAGVAKIESELGLKCELEAVGGTDSVRFDDRCIAAVRSGATQSGFSHRDMVSGAGHDAAAIATVAPAAMIFVPCEQGISHNENENMAPNDALVGAQVLLTATLNIDTEQT